MMTAGLNTHQIDFWCGKRSLFLFIFWTALVIFWYMRVINQPKIYVVSISNLLVTSWESPLLSDVAHMIKVRISNIINTKMYVTSFKPSVFTLQRRAERTMPARLAFVCRNRSQRSSQAFGNFLRVACSLAAVCSQDILYTETCLTDAIFLGYFLIFFSISI